MREKRPLNQTWQFHLGEVGMPMKTARKAAAIGGLTAPIEQEKGPIIPIGEGGSYFLKLIAQGNQDEGLVVLAGTDIKGELKENWKQVSLPHDWKNELPFVNDSKLVMSGFKPDGVAYYRKTFSLEEKLEGNAQIKLHFDGVMRMASVWLNGCFLGENFSGYNDFSFDITELARYGSEGDNVVLVRVDTTTGAEGWWYEGAGIYKDVYLDILPKIQLIKEEIYFETKTISVQQAVLAIHLGIANENYNSMEAISIKLTVEGKEKIWNNISLDELAQKKFKTDWVIEEPRLWSPDKPNLYQGTLQVFQGDQLVDEIKQIFGLRSVSYSENGFYLNGKLTEIKGVCEHQDFGGIGVALNRELIRYKLIKMKEMGVNAYRSAHHFASKNLLELCDELGLIVMNENRILESSPWRINDLQQAVKQTRNHPSVCFWSLCNEEVIGNTTLAKRVAKKLTTVVRQLTTQCLIVSAELLNPVGSVDDEYLASFDVVGVNYPEAGVMGAGLLKIKEKYPKLPLMSTESASYFSTRGIYHDCAEKCQTNNFGSMYSMVLPGKRHPEDPGVGGTAHPEEVLDFYRSNSFMGGVFLWTFTDYYGEPSPFLWPGISSQFGITDTVGLEKDYFYYYQSKWTNKSIIHVAPHWNIEGLEVNEEGLVEVRVFSNYPEIELFINEKSFGKQTAGEHYTTWLVPYEPGILKAVGYRGDEKAEDCRVTAGKLVGLDITERYRSGDITVFEISGIDERGNLVPTAEATIEISLEDGEVIGFTNGDPADISGYNLMQKKLFSGKAVVIVKESTNKNLPNLSGEILFK